MATVSTTMTDSPFEQERVRVSSLKSLVNDLANVEKNMEITNDAFRDAFHKAKQVLELDDQTICKLLKISRLTINRWERGESAPCQLGRPPVFNILRKQAVSKLSLHK